MIATREVEPRFDGIAFAIRDIIENSAEIGCLAHKDADADSLGSVLGFALSLREMGKTVHCFVPVPMPRMLAHLPGYETVSTALPKHLDALFTFDCAALDRFGEHRAFVETMRPVVNIDHHPGNGGFGTVNLIEPDASATGQTVYRLLRTLDAPVSPAVANNLYAALFTDTGGFRHENTTEAALRLGADLVAIGADPAFIALKSYKSRSIEQVKLEGLALSAMQTEFNGTLVWSSVTRTMLGQAGTDLQSADGIIDSLQSVSSMKIAVMFKESSASSTKVSMRTRNEFDASAICRQFGGGGHYRAAGAEIQKPLAEAVPEMLGVIRQVIEESA